MSLFSKILDKLGLGKKKEEEEAEQARVLAEMARKEAEARARMQKEAAARGASTPAPAGGPAKTTTPAATPQAAARPGAPAPAAPKPISEVDVVSKLETLASGKGLNWKTSIADLLVLLELDHSREARIELAKELGVPSEYISGDLSKMNTWLHKEVLKKIAENGGNIPKELLD